MELSDLETFVAIARHGSVSKAAATLFIAQPTATHRLQRLEEELGETLFERRRDGVFLTPAGERVLPHAVAAVEAAREAISSAAPKAPPERPLALAAAPTLAAYRLPAVLAALVRDLPGLGVKVHVARSAAVAELVRRGEADAGFIRSGETGPGLTATVLGREEVVLVAAPGGRKALADWLAGPFIGYDPTARFWHELDVALRTVGARGHTTLELDSLEGVKAMVAEGLGAAFLPLPTVRREIADGRLAVVPLPLELPGRTIALVRRDGPESHPSLRRLTAVALQAFAAVD